MTCKDITEEVVNEIMNSKMPRTRIADESGVHLRTIEFWIQGHTVPSIDNVQCVLAVFGKELCIREKIDDAE